MNGSKIQAGKFNVIIGGQAGSESKGKLSAWLCERENPDLLVMTASPNAGHTVVMPNGGKKVTYHLPVGAVMCDCPIVLGPASLINPTILMKEIAETGIAPERITVDPRASVITQGHLHNEGTGKYSDIGSTLQGIGECRMGKMRRDGTHSLCGDNYIQDMLPMEAHRINCAPVSPIINQALDAGAKVLCEMTQGFDLDLEHGIHPRYCTSKMINPAMAMAEAGVSPSFVGSVFGVIRPYPIRVNNRTGTSGPYTGAKEITWEEVASRCGAPGSFEGEITTTTKLPRRVFEFSWSRMDKFVEICRPTSLCLQFANYIDWEVYGVRSWGVLTPRVVRFLDELSERYRIPVDYVGTGPGHEDMVDLDFERGTWV